ncbi:MAG: TetR/AcrR family transcriptional regulator [Flavobacterium sp.]|nr:MAG: TetR/AcrR family transcriptional regulator [Flavobacterium sp.]
MNKKMEKVSQTSAKSLKREEMVKFAFDTFYKNGFHATGVDTVMEGTGISKRTLYKHFGSKEGLILATIDHYRTFMPELLLSYINENPKANPVEKVLRIFDFLSDRVEAGHENGCFVMNAKTEFVNKAKEIETSCDNYTAGLQNILESTLKETELPNKKELVIQIMILFEGAIIRSKVTRDSVTVKLAKDAARVLCER